MTKIKELNSKDFDTDLMDDLREAAEWRRRGSSLWKEILSKTSFITTLWDSDKMIATGRILEDGAMCFFCDIVVHPDYRGKGYGRRVVERLEAEVRSKNYVHIGLFSEPDVFKFYEKVGFKLVDEGMLFKKHMN